MVTLLWFGLEIAKRFSSQNIEKVYIVSSS